MVAYLRSMGGGGMVVLWAAEEQEGIWHIDLHVGLAHGYRHSSPSSFLGWHLQCLHLVSLHHLTASATQRVETSFHRAVHHAEFGLQMPCNGSKTFPPFTGYELACLADLALIHTQQIQNLWISVMSTWNCILLPMP